MNKFCFSVLAMCLLTSLTGCTEPSGASAETPQTDKGIVILYENDVHCKYQDGYLAMNRMRNSISDTAWVATVSSGDFMQGSTAGAVSDGEYILDIMKPMAYDAITIGNHEFDYGIPTLHSKLPTGNKVKLQAQNALPVTCMNYYNTEADTLVYAPYIMRRYGNKNIAYIGVLTPATLKMESYSFVDKDGKSLPYSITDGQQLISNVQKVVEEARYNGADYVILLSHLGDTETQPYLTSQALVRATRGIDAVLDGHSHWVYIRQIPDLDGKMVTVTQTGTQFANIGKLHISANGQITAQLIPLAETSVYQASATPEVEAALESVNQKMSVLNEEVVATTPFNLVTNGTDGQWWMGMQETCLGNLIADAFRKYGNSDIAFQSAGAIRSALKTGDISLGQAIGVLPFFNEMRTVSATGAEVQALLDSCCRHLPLPNGGFAQVSGLKYTIRQKSTPRVSTEDVQVLNSSTGLYEALDRQKTYTITASAFFLNGSENGKVLANAPVLTCYPKTEYEAFVWYLKEYLKGTVTEQYRNPEGRITIVSGGD